MNQGKYVFSQITDFLPQRIFDKYVKEYHGNKYVKHFTCWNQLLCMVFGQLTNRQSLRDLVVALDAHGKKSYHLGFGKNITLSNLAKANENRNCKIFEDFAYHLITIAREFKHNKDFEIKGQVYAFDSSTIDLCLSIFWWAKFRRNKGGIKLNTLFDVNTQIPAFIHISTASSHDVNAMDFLIYEIGAYYIFDRGYIDYTRLYKIDQFEAFFVIRAKTNLKFRRIYSRKYEKSSGVKSDQIGKLTGFYISKEYPKKLRKVRFYDEETSRTFVFLTNNMELPAKQIAFLYKQRWQVELFFKWIKQHLKVKSFWGTSENAVKIQIYTAVTTYCLISILQKNIKTDKSTYKILQVLSLSLLDKTPVKEILTNNDYKNDSKPIHNQLKIKLF
jgi:hypothetical protein